MKKMWRDVPIAVAVAMCFVPSLLLAAPAAAPQSAASVAPASSAVVASAPQVSVIKDCDVCPELVTIPSGSFMMGAEPNSYGYVLNQRPAHKVEVQKFLLGRTEVTQGQYRTLMGTNPSYFDSCGDNCPMEFVSWDEARDYINKLSEKTGRSTACPQRPSGNTLPVGASRRFSGGVTPLIMPTPTTAKTHVAGGWLRGPISG